MSDPNNSQDTPAVTELVIEEKTFSKSSTSFHKPRYPIGLPLPAASTTALTVKFRSGIILLPTVFEQIFSWVYATDVEVMVLGTVKEHAGHIVVDEVFLIEQEASGGEAELDPVAQAMFMDEHPDTIIRFCAHTHPIKTWSQDDETLCSTLVSDYLVSMFINDAFQVCGRIDLLSPARIVIDHVPVYVGFAPDVTGTARADVEEKVSRKRSVIVPYSKGGHTTRTYFPKTVNVATRQTHDTVMSSAALWSPIQNGNVAPGLVELPQMVVDACDLVEESDYAPAWDGEVYTKKTSGSTIIVSDFGEVEIPLSEEWNYTVLSLLPLTKPEYLSGTDLVEAIRQASSYSPDTAFDSYCEEWMTEQKQFVMHPKARFELFDELMDIIKVLIRGDQQNDLYEIEEVFELEENAIGD